ncbi:MAG: lipocalin family protein [Firmicutes bacterium]|nr:lipocalin family protein [Bacillota bacterium]
MKKKLVVAAVMAIIMVVPMVMLTGCGRGPSSEDLHGRWELTETRQGPSNNEQTFRPGSLTWLGGYFIEFRADGTFTEVDFWNRTAGTIPPEGISIGTWSINNRGRLSMTRTGGIATLPFVFIGTREVSLDGNTLTMSYRRRVPGTSNNYWNYTHVFTRAAASA